MSTYNEWLNIASADTGFTVSCSQNTGLAERKAEITVKANNGGDDPDEIVYVTQDGSSPTGSTYSFLVKVESEEGVNVSGGTITIEFSEPLTEITASTGVELSEDKKRVRITLGEGQMIFGFSLTSFTPVIVQKITWEGLTPSTEEDKILTVSKNNNPIISNRDPRYGNQDVYQMAEGEDVFLFYVEKLKKNESNFTVAFPFAENLDLSEKNITLTFSRPILRITRIEGGIVNYFPNGNVSINPTSDSEVSFTAEYDVDTILKKFYCLLRGTFTTPEEMSEVTVNFGWNGERLIDYSIGIKGDLNDDGNTAGGNNQEGGTDGTGQAEDTGDTSDHQYEIDFESTSSCSDWSITNVKIEESFQFSVNLDLTGDGQLATRPFYDANSGTYVLHGNYSASELANAISTLKSTPISKFNTITGVFNGSDVTTATMAYNEWEQAHMEVPTPQEASGTTVNP